MTDVSICIATYNKPTALRRVLRSILDQALEPSKYEVIVVDDGSPTNASEEVCRKMMIRGLPLRYYRFRYGKATYGNPAVARNQAYTRARAPVVICQSDDVVHGEGAVERLLADMRPGRFVIGQVLNTDWDLKPKGCGHPRNSGLVELSGPRYLRPLLFLGTVRREDIYAIGGNDERFRTPGKEDVFFVDCLTKGLGLVPFFSTARGYHLHHDRPPSSALEESDRLYKQITTRILLREEHWRARGAPWPVPVDPPLQGQGLAPLGPGGRPVPREAP